MTVDCLTLQNTSPKDSVTAMEEGWRGSKSQGSGMSTSAVKVSPGHDGLMMDTMTLMKSKLPWLPVQGLHRLKAINALT